MVDGIFFLSRSYFLDETMGTLIKSVINLRDTEHDLP